jgi:hypothetical protein
MFTENLGRTDDGVVDSARHRFEDGEPPTVDGSTIGVDGDGHMGPGVVHDARSFGDTRPVAGV